MEEEDLANRLYAYLFYAGAVALMLLSLVSYNPVIVGLASALMLFSVVYLNSGHILNNLLIRRSAVVEIYNGYVVNGRLPAAVKKIGSGFVGVSVAVLQLGKESGIDAGGLRSLLESMHEPFEFSISLEETDRERILEGLETKRRMKEIALTKTDRRRYDVINGINREIEFISSEISRMRSGKTYSLLLRLKTRSRSKGMEEAALSSSRGMEHVAGAFSSAFGLRYKILSGEELLESVEAYA